ncbi:hypothetical protein DHEL01_v202137 [Diaporthe helianthi]|uniref:Uncharacterized protein n=1 Tax=Diaporthe helianthi TaxID=158607 RepID=A0A2P5IAH9_DIAHE|nr:hypothetical protein DHEL01_v202137 [Diaporthe helianthi]
MYSISTKAATLLALASIAAANTWTLYCGDSCSGGTEIATGSNFTGAGCTNLASEYKYCYLSADELWYYGVVYQEADCLVSSDGPRSLIEPGGCTDAGAFGSYRIVVDL